MKKNKKSVSVKNTKSFLGNPPALANATFFVPAANLNANDGIFTDLHDAPSNFSSSNQDPNWDFDISNKIFSQSDKKKIFSDDKFKNMIDYNQDRYTGDMFSDYFVPVENYYGVESAVSPVLAEINYPRYQSDVDPQSASRMYGDTFMNADVIKQGQQSNSDYFNNPNVFATSNSYQTPTEVEIPRYYSPVEPQPVSVGIAPIDANYFAPSDDVIFATSKKEGYTMPTEVENPRYQSDIDPQPVISSRLNEYGQAAPPEAIISSDEELIKLIGQEKFDSEVASKYRDGMLISPPPTPEMPDVVVQNAVDPLPDSNNVETASIQPITVEEDKKAKKPFNWLPIILVAAAVGGYMYYNRKK
jgi:hypothetical protein